VRRAAHIAVGDTLDKAGHIDACRAGGLAGSVKAVVAAVGFVSSLKSREWRVRVAKVLGVLRRG